MAVEMVPADALVRSEIGPGGYTRDQARAQVRGILMRLAAANPAFMKLVRIWDADGDDTVYAGPFTWTVYEAEDPRTGAMVWLEDYAATMRRAGVSVSIAELPG